MVQRVLYIVQLLRKCGARSLWPRHVACLLIVSVSCCGLELNTNWGLGYIPLPLPLPLYPGLLTCSQVPPHAWKPKPLHRLLSQGPLSAATTQAGQRRGEATPCQLSIAVALLLRGFSAVSLYTCCEGVHSSPVVSMCTELVAFLLDSQGIGAVL